MKESGFFSGFGLKSLPKGHVSFSCAKSPLGLGAKKTDSSLFCESQHPEFGNKHTFLLSSVSPELYLLFAIIPTQAHKSPLSSLREKIPHRHLDCPDTTCSALKFPHFSVQIRLLYALFYYLR